jgi:predicted small integral membrane protein
MIIRNKPLFYFLSCTWGIIMTLIGAFVALGLLITGHKPKKYGHCIHFEVGKHWGGVNLGLFFLTDDSASDPTKNHEHGHGFQNAVLGPLFPFLVAIPSATRYWLLEFATRKGKKIFSAILYAAFVVLAAVLLIIAICTQPWVFILPVFVFLYSTAIFCWLMFKEIPQYDFNNVPYDAIWFEGQATRLGNEFIAFRKYGLR